jgi:hypothetical protein
MAKDSKTKLHKVKMGGYFYAFRAPKDAYKSIGSALGVLDAKDTDDNLAIGAAVRPPKVRLNLANGKAVIRYCDPNKIESVIVKGALNGKKYDGQNINSVRALNG